MAAHPTVTREYANSVEEDLSEMSVQTACKSPKNGEKTVRKSLKVLDLISQQKDSMSTKELAKELNVSLPTAYNLLSSLIQEGYVERMPNRSGYRLGPMISKLYRRSLFSGSIVSDIEPVLEELSAITSQRSYLAAREDCEMVVADIKETGDSPGLPDRGTGLHGAAYALSIGKVLLAHTSQEQLGEYLENVPLDPFTHKTITTQERLKVCLTESQVSGLATDFEEFAEGFCCIASPVRNEDGQVEAAIGISAEAKQFRVAGQDYAKAVIKAASEASILRGYVDNEKHRYGDRES